MINCVFYDAPPALALSERRAVSWILKFPFTAFSLSGFLNLSRWGGCKVRSVKCTSLATFARSAAKRKSVWRSGCAELTRIYNVEESLLPFVRCVHGTPWGQWWDKDAVSFSLRSVFWKVTREVCFIHVFPVFCVKCLKRRLCGFANFPVASSNFRRPCMKNCCRYFIRTTLRRPFCAESRSSF